MSADVEPSEHAEPAAVMHDLGWRDGWEGLAPEPPTDRVDLRRVYLDAHELAVRERAALPAFCVDCEGVHAAGDCSLVPPERDPWWQRALASLAARWPERSWEAELDEDRRRDR